MRKNGRRDIIMPINGLYNLIEKERGTGMKEVHLICNAHIDPIWQWDWPEGVSAALATFRSAADLFEKHDYIFCHTPSYKEHF